MKKEVLLHRSFDESAQMLATTEKMFNEMTSLLRDSDNADSAIDVYAEDKTVNAGERDIRRKVLTHLTVMGNQSDINAAFVLITIIHDMERIGDYCKNIYELAQKHPEKLHFTEADPKVKTVESIISKTFASFNQNFQDTSKEKSRDMMHDLADAKKTADDIIDDFLEGTYGKDSDTKTVVTKVMYLRFLKRIAAHLNNIATSFVNPFDRIGFEE